jgi:hypothetical protein
VKENILPKGNVLQEAKQGVLIIELCLFLEDGMDIRQVHLSHDKPNYLAGRRGAGWSFRLTNALKPYQHSRVGTPMVKSSNY